VLAALIFVWIAAGKFTVTERSIVIERAQGGRGKITTLALTDGLGGLANRTTFAERQVMGAVTYSF
jgi:hypothetical protein